MWSAVLGPDPLPPPTPDERQQLGRIRAKRTFFWFWIVSAAPVAYLADVLLGVDLFALGRVWVLGGLAAGVWLGFFTPCPRCGEQYHATRWWGSPWTQRCLHCGFALRPPPLAR